ncbi:MAG: PAS domain S-box protein [Chloroflexi bacterium]|nr:PAS domain S-box protein [Chloroflexota bacterium]
MNTPLRVLVIEDSEDDTTLLIRTLRRNGYEPRFKRVETSTAMQAALVEESWDIILSDFSMPQFSALEALDLLKSSGLDLPFIIISGTIGEDVAVQALLGGAHDFLLKGQLSRLIPAIERELREVKVRRARHEAEVALRRSHERLRLLHAIDLAILNAASPTEIADGALYFMNELIPCQLMVLMLFDKTAHTALLLSFNGEPAFTQPLTQTEQLLPLVNFEGFEDLQAGQHRLIRGGTGLFSRFQTIDPLMMQLQVEVQLPLIAQKELIGILMMGAVTTDFFTTEHLEIAREIAVQLAIGLHQARLDEQLRRYATELEQRVLQRTTELNAAKDRVEAILNNSSDGIALAYLNGVIRQVNPAFKTLFGYPLAETFSQSLQDLLEPASAKNLTDIFGELVIQRLSRHIEVMAQRRNGTTFTAEFALALIAENAHDPVSLVCAVRDISSHKALEVSLRKAYEKEKELNELKSRFVSMISHEFRNPLAAIQMSADVLATYMQRLSDSDKRDWLGKITDQVTQLNEMVDEVLAIGRLESEKFEFTGVILDLNQFCVSFVQEMRLIRNSHIIIYTCQMPDKCREVVVDAKLLKQILTNLLTNAMKYSPAGSSIQLTLDCIGDQAVLQIQDQGIGIPEKALDHLFEPFYRANNVGNITGTGLGLAIVKRAVDLHGGTISCTSVVNLGTTFTVTIPLKRRSL